MVRAFAGRSFIVEPILFGFAAVDIVQWLPSCRSGRHRVRSITDWEGGQPRIPIPVHLLLASAGGVPEGFALTFGVVGEFCLQRMIRADRGRLFASRQDRAPAFIHVELLDRTSGIDVALYKRERNG